MTPLWYGMCQRWFCNKVLRPEIQFLVLVWWRNHQNHVRIDFKPWELTICEYRKQNSSPEWIKMMNGPCFVFLFCGYAGRPIRGSLMLKNIQHAYISIWYFTMPYHYSNVRSHWTEAKSQKSKRKQWSSLDQLISWYSKHAPKPNAAQLSGMRCGDPNLELATCRAVGTFDICELGASGVVGKMTVQNDF